MGAVRELTLDIAEGEFVVLVGASGSGKTTLLRCIAGLEKPDSGRIVIGGRTVFADQPPVWVSPLVKKLGTAVLYVTHDQIEAMAMADRIGLMRFGELLQVGQPAQVYRHPVQQEVADFFGHVNWLPGTILDGEVVETPVGRLPSSKCGSLDRGTAVLAGFRPESVILGGACTPGCGSFEASLTSSMFLGDAYLHKLTAAGLPILAKTAEPVAAADDQVTLSVRPESLFVFAHDSVARQ